MKKDTIRGDGSNFVTTNCYDVENETWIMKTLDLRESIDRFIPEYLMQQYDNDIEDNVHTDEWYAEHFSEILKEAFTR